MSDFENVHLGTSSCRREEAISSVTDRSPPHVGGYGGVLREWLWLVCF